MLYLQVWVTYPTSIDSFWDPCFLHGGEEQGLGVHGLRSVDI